MNERWKFWKLRKCICTLLKGCLQTTFTISHFLSRRLEVKRSLSNILMEVGRTESRLSTFDINIDATRNTWKKRTLWRHFVEWVGRLNSRFEPWSLHSLKLNCWQVLRWKHCDSYRCEYLKSSPPFQTKNKENLDLAVNSISKLHYISQVPRNMLKLKPEKWRTLRLLRCFYKPTSWSHSSHSASLRLDVSEEELIF